MALTHRGTWQVVFSFQATIGIKKIQIAVPNGFGLIASICVKAPKTTRGFGEGLLGQSERGNSLERGGALARRREIDIAPDLLRLGLAEDQPARGTQANDGAGVWMLFLRSPAACLHSPSICGRSGSKVAKRFRKETQKEPPGGKSTLDQSSRFGERADW